MSIESVKNQFRDHGLVLDIIEFNQSTATVDLAAQAVGVEPGQIAKTMSFRLKDRDILVVLKGTTRIDNKKYKQCFQTKAKMLSLEEVELITGHPVGGVCPFGLTKPLDIYLDESLKSYRHVYPAAGSKNSAVKISIEQLEQVTSGQWISIGKDETL